MSLPSIYGFIKNWWCTTVVDVMREKKKDVKNNHQLQTIGILEADFNTALKVLLFVEKLMAHAQCTGLHEEQWGS